MNEGRRPGARFASLVALVALALAVSPVRAQGASTAAAEALFQEGRKLFKAGDTAQACPKLAESQRLDPATGTLLALAMCHEQEKKLASAWAEFTDVEAQARRAGRKDRETLARDHAAALRSRLSTLTLEVPSAVAQLSGLELKVDGSANGSGSWGVAVPVDGGEHLVEASAPGRVPWSKKISIKRESDAARVVIPSLAEEPSAAPTAAGEAEKQPTADSKPPSSDVEPIAPVAPEAKRGSGLRLAGAIAAGAGLVVMGAGGVVAFTAKGNYDDAKKSCSSDDLCTQGPYDDIQDARGQGTLATVIIVAGGAVAVGGAALWLFAPRAQEQTAKRGLRLERVGVGPGSVVLGGRF